MKTALVRTFGFMGDALYASSLAEKLKEDGYDRITYLTGIPQVVGMLNRNPFIDEVLLTKVPTHDTHHVIVGREFDKEIFIPECFFVDPPCIEMQKSAGIINPTANFTVYTDSVLDAQVAAYYKDTPYIAIMETSTWEAKSYLCTKEQYATAADVPNLGRGGKHRNIAMLVSALEKQIPDIGIVVVGAPIDHPTLALPFSNGNRSLDLEASIVKYAMAFVGAEGGMANVAAGVGTRTILTYDFVHQLYGWRGSVKPVKLGPKLGPRYYFTDVEHIDINPYLSDEDVGIEMGKCVLRDYSGCATDKIFMGKRGGIV